MFEKQRNTHTLCLHGDETDFFWLPEELDYIDEIYSGDGLLQVHNIEPDGDRLLHDHIETSQTGEGHRSGNHHCTNNDTDHNVPDVDTHRCLSANPVVESCPPDQKDAPLVFRETVIHNQHLRCENDKACSIAATTNQLHEMPLFTAIRRSQVQIYTNTMIIMVRSLASTYINSNPFTYAEAMNCLQQDHWKWAKEVECTFILLSTTFAIITSRGVSQ